MASRWLPLVTRLDRPTPETIHSCAQFIGESAECVLNELIDGRAEEGSVAHLRSAGRHEQGARQAGRVVIRRDDRTLVGRRAAGMQAIEQLRFALAMMIAIDGWSVRAHLARSLPTSYW